MYFSTKRLMRRYFSRKLLWAGFWFTLVCVVLNFQIEMFYGPWAKFADDYPYILGMICGFDIAAFGVGLGNLLTRIVTNFNYTGRLRRDLRHYLPEREADDPYALLDADLCYQPARQAAVYLGDEWLVMPGHAMLRRRLAGVFYEELRKSFLSNRVRLTVVDDAGNSFYLDIIPSLHPELFHKLAQLHPGATNADHRVLRSFWQQQGADYHKLRLNNDPPRKISDPDHF